VPAILSLPSKLHEANRLIKRNLGNQCEIYRIRSELNLHDVPLPLRIAVMYRGSSGIVLKENILYSQFDVCLENILFVHMCLYQQLYLSFLLCLNGISHFIITLIINRYHIVMYDKMTAMRSYIVKSLHVALKSPNNLFASKIILTID